MGWETVLPHSSSQLFFSFLHSIIAPFLGLSHEGRCMCPGPPRKLADRISRKQSQTSIFSSQQLLLLWPRLYRLKFLITVYLITQQSIFGYIPFEPFRQNGLTAYYSTCYHKAQTICLVLSKELFDAIRCLQVFGFTGVLFKENKCFVRQKLCRLFSDGL